MIECITQQSSLTYRWTFDRMLPALPIPNTAAFVRLCQGLQPFGIAPSRVSIEGPTSWLSDVELRIFLLDAERATLRMSYGSFELNIRYLSSGDDASLENILKTLFAVLGEIDADSRLGRAQVILNAHMSLKDYQADVFLGDHLCGREKNPGLIPELFYYKVRLGDEVEVSEMRIGIAKSLLFENSLFAECTVEYVAPDNPESCGERSAADGQRAFTLLGLSPKSVLKVDGDL